MRFTRHYNAKQRKQRLCYPRCKHRSGSTPRLFIDSAGVPAGNELNDVGTEPVTRALAVAVVFDVSGDGVRLDRLDALLALSLVA